MVAEPEQKNIPDFRAGDTIRVYIKVVEGESERVQAFEGTCLSRRGSGDCASFTVRKVSFGVGVERTFPVISPSIEKIEVLKTGRVRRARLYYLQDLTGKAARVNEHESQQQGSKDAAPSADGKAPAPKADAPPSPEKKASAAKGAKSGETVAKKAALGAAAQ
jgi:large subunit ribosomal protein L19